MKKIIVETDGTLLAIERVINLLRKKLYKIESLNIQMHSIMSVISIEINEDEQSHSNMIKQLQKLIDIKSVQI